MMIFLPNPPTIKAIVTLGNGGYEQLVYTDVPVPVLDRGEVLLQVLAAGINNTDINTRVGWYSASVTSATEAAASNADEKHTTMTDGGWNEKTPFPFILGTDCCGRIVAVAPGEDENLMGQRALVRSCMRPAGFGSPDNVWLGSDFNGAFAQFVKVPANTF